MRREVFESSVLSGLKTHLMQPDLVKEFVGEHRRELNRATAECAAARVATGGAGPGTPNSGHDAAAPQTTRRANSGHRLSRLELAQMDKIRWGAATTTRVSSRFYLSRTAFRKLRVRSLRGELKMTDGSPCSTMRPFSMNMTRSETSRANDIS
jgi:hypothetical protein